MKNVRLARVMMGGLSICCLLIAGCSSEQAKDKLNKAESGIDKAAGTISTGAEDLAGKGSQMASDAVENAKGIASELGEKAMGYLNPLKDKLGNLDSLKEKPEDLKASIEELLKSMEAKAEGFELPEVVTKGLASIKEKLIALKDYLGGEFEQEKINEHLKGIADSVKSAFGS